MQSLSCDSTTFNFKGIGGRGIGGAGSYLVNPSTLPMARTAGTGKTVVINEMVRAVGPKKFKLLAPTGNAACGTGGQMW